MRRDPTAPFPRIYVSIEEQRLLFQRSPQDGHPFPVSTGKNPPSNLADSGGTPTGLHRICGKFGDLLPAGAVLKGRRFIGKLAFQLDPMARLTAITSRILQLEGLEPGSNSGLDDGGRCCDSRDRLIYIHGIGDERDIGRPASHGCINMRNAHIIHLFDWVSVGTLVLIE